MPYQNCPSLVPLDLSVDGSEAEQLHVPSLIDGFDDKNLELELSSINATWKLLVPSKFPTLSREERDNFV